MEIISRKEAKEKGLKRYFTGKPCKRGHITERMVSTLTCVACKNERERELYWQDPKAATERTKGWQSRNRERHNARAVRYITERRKSDPLFAFKCSVKTLVAKALQKKGFRKNGRTREILGCSLDEFIAHIERQFLPGMTWENRHLWHVDHITPLATAETEEDVIALNHVSNLRPIWAADNIEKRDKLLFLI